MTPLHLTQEQLDAIRANSISDEAYQTTLEIIANQTNTPSLADSEQCLQLFLETASDPVVIYDEIGHVAHVNALFTQRFGWTAEDIQGQRLDFVPEENQQETAQAIQALMKNGRVERFETCRYSKDGTILNTVITVTSFTDQDGNYNGMMEILRDASQEIQINHDQLEKKIEERTAELQEANTQLEQQSHLLSALTTLTAEINYSLDPKTIWDTIAKISVETVGATSAYVSTYDQAAKTETVVAEYFSAAASDQERVSDLGQSYDFERDFGQMTEEFMSKPFHISHVDDPTVPQAEREHMIEYGAKSTLSVPLVANRELIGLLEIWETREKHEFNQNEIDTIIAFARQAGNSIYNAQLYNQANQEVAAKQEAQEALASSEAKFKTLVENSITAIYIIQDGHYTYVNDAFSEITGFTAEELMERPALEFIHEEDKQIVSQNIQRRLDGEIEAISYQLRFATKAGPYIVMEVHGAASEYEGRPAILGSMLNVTEQVQSREQINYQAKVLQEISDAVISVNTDFIVQTWNKAAEEMYGYKSNEVIGRFIGDFITTTYEHFAPNEGVQVLMKEGRFVDRGAQVTQNGREFIVDSSSNVMTDETGAPTGYVAVNRDITQIIQAESQLRQSQQRLAQLVEQSPLAFIEWDENFCVQEWNKAAEQIFGHTREEALGQHAKFILTEEVWPIVDVIWEHLTNLTGGERSTNKNITADNQEIVCDWYNSSLVNNDGKVVGVVSVVEDITEQQQADEILRQSQQRLAQLVEQSPLAFIEWDENFCVQEWNKAAERIFGHTREEALGQHAKFILTEEVWPIVDVIWDHLIKLTGGERSTNKNITADSQEIICDWYNSSLIDSDGKVVGVVSVVEDITERQQADEILRQSQQRLAQLIEQSPLAFIEWDMNFCVREWNRAAENILGYTREEALGQHAEFILTEAAKPIVNDIWQHLTTLTGGERSTNQNVTADGRIIDCDWYNTSLTDGEGEVTGVVSIVEDITERVKQEQATQKRQQLIEKQSQLSLLISEELITSQGRQHALQVITEEAANMLNVGRASIWGYQQDPQAIHLLDLFEASENKHSDDVTLGQDAAPSYFKALENERILVANDVYDHYSTHDLLDFYLEPLGITSMLDTFVRIGDQVRGVVCLEHTGPKREWSLDEQSFANYLADLVAFIFEEEERQRLQLERNRLSNILENTIDFVGMADHEGNITYLNAAGREMAGLLEDADITQIKVESLIADRMRKFILKEALPKAIDQGHWQGESIMIHQQEHYEIPISQVIIPNTSPEGELLGFSTIVRDIAEQKQQESQIRLRLELNQALDEARTENETLQIVTEKARFYPNVGVGITKREIIDGQIIDMIVQQAPFDSSLEQLPIGTPLRYEQITLDAIENDQPFYTNDFGNDKRLSELSYESSARTGVNSIAILPIFTGSNERYGSLIAVTSEAGFFDSFKVDLYRTLAEQTSISLRGVKLDEQIQQSLERRGRQVRITTQISQEIASSTEIYELYQRVVELTKEQFGYYHTQLLQYNPALDAVALIVGYGNAGQKMLEYGHSMPLGVGIIGTAAATGQSVLRTDVDKDPNWRANDLLPHTKAELAVPIKLGSEVLGILDVQSDQIGQLTEEDQLVLEGLCGQIAVAIEGTRLRQDMNERLQELNNLQRLMTREGWENVQVGQAVSHTGYVFDQQGLQPMSKPANGARNGHGRLKQLETKVTNPIKIRDEVIGTIQLEDTPDNPLSQEDQELLDAISRQVAEALENARLIEQTRKRALELETVARVSATTSTILEVEQLLQSVARLTQSSFGLSHAHIYMLDDDRQNLQLVAGTGEVGALMVAENWQVAITDENSVVSRVARARRGMVISDVRQETHHRPNPFMPDNRAELAVPMIAGDELLGILDLHSSMVNFFSNEDLRIHTTLATQVAVALQNANLYQEQLETAEKLREFDRLKSQFLASMSHELRTPLNSIIGFADVLLEGIDGELNDRMREDVLLIRDGGQHLRALIGDILDMSKIEAGMMDLTYGNIDMKRIAHEVMATTQGLITEKPIKLMLDMDESLEMIEADRTRVVQILLNLLSNAAKFTDKGSITLSMQRQDDEFMVVGVKDTGVGIKPEDAKLVFEQFQQIGGMEHRKAGGTGLGMPITKQLVEMHGGKIWIDSVPGVGSTFWFTLPFVRPEGLDTQRDSYYA